MGEQTKESGTMRYDAREVVGVFPTASALGTAVEQLEIAGVDRAAISVLGVDPKRSGQIDTLYRSAEAIEDDPAARQAAFVSQDLKPRGKLLQFPCRLGLVVLPARGPWRPPEVPWPPRSGPPSLAVLSVRALACCWFVPSPAIMRRISNPSSHAAGWCCGSAHPMTLRSSAHWTCWGAVVAGRCTPIASRENGG